MVTSGMWELLIYRQLSQEVSAYLPLFGLIQFSVVLSLMPSSLGIFRDICDPMKNREKYL